MKDNKNVIPAGVNERIMAAPPEYWEAAKSYDYCDAYAASEREPIHPCPDKTVLNDTLVEKLHDIGLYCAPIHPREAALPVLKVEIMPEVGEAYDSSLWETTFPACNPTTDREFSVYGIDLLFSSNDAEICCDISYHFTEHSGGGYEKVGTIGIMVDGDYFFSHPHYMNLVAHEDFGMYDYTSITALCNWIGYLWRGIQHQLIYRPEVIHVSHRRVPKEERDAANNRTDKTRIVKVQKIISILAEGEPEEVISHTTHTFYLPVWNVSGHWRTLPCGRRVWIHPYQKGNARNTGCNYGKEYRFIGEDAE